MDFDDEWDSFANDVLSEDFGVTIRFVNECVLEQPANPRPILTPTPNCDNIYVTSDWFEGDDYRIRVRNNNLPQAYLVQSVLSWPAPIRRNEPYVNYLYLGSISKAPQEVELLLHRNQKMQIVNVEKGRNNKYIVYMNLLPTVPEVPLQKL